MTINKNELELVEYSQRFKKFKGKKIGKVYCGFRCSELNDDWNYIYKNKIVRLEYISKKDWDENIKVLHGESYNVFQKNENSKNVPKKHLELKG